MISSSDARNEKKDEEERTDAVDATRSPATDPNKSTEQEEKESSKIAAVGPLISSSKESEEGPSAVEDQRTTAIRTADEVTATVESSISNRNNKPNESSLAEKPALQMDRGDSAGLADSRAEIPQEETAMGSRHKESAQVAPPDAPNPPPPPPAEAPIPDRNINRDRDSPPKNVLIVIPSEEQSESTLEDESQFGPPPPPPPPSTSPPKEPRGAKDPPAHLETQSSPDNRNTEQKCPAPSSLLASVGPRVASQPLNSAGAGNNLSSSSPPSLPPGSNKSPPSLNQGRPKRPWSGSHLRPLSLGQSIAERKKKIMSRTKHNDTRGRGINKPFTHTPRFFDQRRELRVAQVAKKGATDANPNALAQDKQSSDATMKQPAQSSWERKEKSRGIFPIVLPTPTKNERSWAALDAHLPKKMRLSFGSAISHPSTDTNTNAERTSQVTPATKTSSVPTTPSKSCSSRANGPNRPMSSFSEFRPDEEEEQDDRSSIDLKRSVIAAAPVTVPLLEVEKDKDEELVGDFNFLDEEDLGRRPETGAEQRKELLSLDARVQGISEFKLALAKALHRYNLARLMDYRSDCRREIPTNDEAWTLLAKQGFSRQRRLRRLYLPSDQRKGDPTSPSFDSIDDLRRYLAEQDAPCWATGGDSRLDVWIRFAPFPALSHLTQEPKADVSMNAAIAWYLLQQMGFREKDGKYCKPPSDGNDEVNFDTFDDLHLHLARHGLPSELSTSSIGLSLFLANCPRVPSGSPEPIDFMRNNSDGEDDDAQDLYFADEDDHNNSRKDVDNDEMVTLVTGDNDRWGDDIDDDGSNAGNDFDDNQKNSSNEFCFDEVLFDELPYHPAMDGIPPVRTTYPGAKSISRTTLYIDGRTTSIRSNQQLDFFTTLGQCRIKEQDTFHWYNAEERRPVAPIPVSSDVYGFNNRLGRLYFKSFSFRKTIYRVGDFLMQSDDAKNRCYYRIIGAYQAMRSFLGKYGRKNAIIQKRGHPFLICVQLFSMSSITPFMNQCGKKRKSPQDSGNSDDKEVELVLQTDCRWSPGCVESLPLWISPKTIENMSRIHVEIVHPNDAQKKHQSRRKDTEDGGNTRYFCRRMMNCSLESKRRRQGTELLSDSLPIERYNLLNCPPHTLLSDYVPENWESVLEAKQVQCIHTFTEKRKSSQEEQRDIDLQYQSDSSDDSDDFDEESKKIIFDSESSSVAPSDREGPSASPHKKGAFLLRALRDRAKKKNYSEPLPQLVIAGEVYDSEAMLEEKDQQRNEQNDFQIQTKLTEAEKLCHDSGIGKVLKLVRQKLDLQIENTLPVSELFSVRAAAGLEQNSNDGPERKLIEQKLVSLGYRSFRGSQAEVCHVASQNLRDVVYIAPTGHGKSLCFEVPALIQGGIIIVVEPYKEIIKDRISKYKDNRLIQAEQLKSVEDRERLGGVRAEQRLIEIVNDCQRKKRFKSTNDHLLLFATPELTVQDGVLDQLERLDRHQALTRIVFDEFDVSGERTEDYRSAYEAILKKISIRCPTVKFTCLTATLCRDDLVDFWQGVRSERPSKPELIEHDRPIAESLVFSVERKISDTQVSERIAAILEHYKNCNDGVIPKAVCYCVAVRLCQEMAKHLKNIGVKAEAMTAQLHEDEKNNIKRRLIDGETQVICATKVFGRGVDIPDIRFIFHASLPTSLSDYVQATGRAGRDGKPAYCILFYRPHDRHSAEKVLKLVKPPTNEHVEVLTGEKRKRAVKALDAVESYCTSGDAAFCRYGMLAPHVCLLPEAHELKCKENVMCDNCRILKKRQPNFGIQGEDEFISLDESKQPIELASINVNEWVLQFLDRLEEGISEINANDILKRLAEKLSNEYAKQETKAAKAAALVNIRIDQMPVSLRADLFRLLATHKLVRRVSSGKAKNLLRGNDLASFVASLKAGRTHVLMRYVPVPSYLLGPETKASEDRDTFDSIDDLNLLPSEAKVAEKQRDFMPPFTFDDLQPLQPEATSKILKTEIPPHLLRALASLSFLVQFELWRLLQEGKLSPRNIEFNLNDVLSKKCTNLEETIKKIHETGSSMHSIKPYEKVVRLATALQLPLDSGSGTEAFGGGSGLYFPAYLENSDRLKLVLLPPEKAADRRLFRRFGSHRFLHINVSNKVPEKIVRSLTDDVDLRVCGRKYGFFWAKVAKSPQLFIFFAESGVGIKPNEEMSVSDLRNWCLPPGHNPDLTLGKEFKRLKLCYSKTTACGVLPPNCVRIIPDIENNGHVMTDGCGLISRDALDFVWEGWTQNQKINAPQLPTTDITQSPGENENSDEEDCCPYTSFQGRIGGMKGMWVLDKNLGSGIRLLCRESQVKFLLPMKSLEDSGARLSASPYDELYDTVDVCSWDESPEEGKLNLRLIQILEYRGVELGYFEKCCAEGMKWLAQILEDPSHLKLFISSRHSTMTPQESEEANDDSLEDDLLFRMVSVDMDKNEPIFAQKLETIIRRDAESMRDKGKYPIKCCRTLRMFPDHTGLLEDGEAFIAYRAEKNTRETQKIENAEFVVAMRSPAYFAGDLIKLKLVDNGTLRHRAAKFGHDYYDFFDKLQTGLVLSTKGPRSAADMMSGGDFDGDKAWVCWDQVMTNQISDCPPEDTTTKDFQITKSKEEMKAAKDVTLADRTSYTLHFRKHQNQLGILSNLLDLVNDYFDVDSPEAKAIGCQGFLQVDHPYKLCRIAPPFREKLEERKLLKPHWLQRDSNQTYTSLKAFGILWNHVEEMLTRLKVQHGKGKMNEHVIALIREEEQYAVENKDNERKLSLTRLRKKMRGAIKEYYKSYRDFSLTEEGKSKEKFLDWQKQQFKKWRGTLIGGERGEDAKNLACAVLYEENWNQSVEKGKTERVFAWNVAHDRLLRIIGDGVDAKKGRVTVMPGFTRGNEADLFGKGKR